MATLADRLKMARAERRLTTRELAKLAEVDFAWINRLENGVRHNVSLAVALRLACALHVTLDWLVGRYGAQKAPQAEHGEG